MKSIHNKLKNNTGATILMALALMAVAVVVSFIVVTTATTSSKIVLPNREIELSSGLTLSCESVTDYYSGADNYGEVAVTVDGQQFDNLEAIASAGVLLQYRTSGDSGWTTSAPYVTGAGSKTVQVKASKDGYKTVYGNYSITVKPSDVLEVTANKATYTYDGTSHTVNVSVKANGVSLTTASIQYKTSQSAQYDSSIPSFTDAGTYTLYVKVSCDNYVEKELTFTNIIEISKRPITLTATDEEMVYNGKEQTLSDYSISSGTLASNQTASITYKASGTNVGEYPGSFSTLKILDKSSNKDVTKNYTITTTVGKLTIKPVTDTVTVTIKGNSGNFTYDGASHTISGYTFSSDNSAYTETCCKFSGTKTLTRTDAGTYDLGLKVANFTNISTTNFKNVKFVVYDGSMTINKRSASFDGETQINVPYTSSAQSFTGITANNLLSGHTFSGISYVVTGTAPGTYTGQFSGTATIKDSNGKDVTANYNITYNPGTLKIKPASKDNADSSIKLVKDQLNSELKSYKYEKTEYKDSHGNSSKYQQHDVNDYGEYNQVTDWVKVKHHYESETYYKNRIVDENGQVAIGKYTPRTPDHPKIDYTTSGLFYSYITNAINNYLNGSTDSIFFTVQPNQISGMTVPVDVTMSISQSGCNNLTIQITLKATYVDDSGQEKTAQDTLSAKVNYSTSDTSESYERTFNVQQKESYNSSWSATNQTKTIKWTISCKKTTVTFKTNY